MFESYPITLDGLTFAWGGSTEFPDADGSSLITTKLEGWNGPPGRELNQQARPGDDGVFDGDAFRGARSLSMDGRYFARSDFRRVQLERRVAAMCADPTRLYPFTVTDPVNPLTAYVRIAGDTKAEPVNPFRGEFSLSLNAPNPLRQAPWVTSNAPTGTAGSGGVVSTAPGVVSTAPGVVSGTAPTPSVATVSNPGTGPAIVVAQFVGPATNPALVRMSDGAVIQVTTTLASGESLFLNLSIHYAHEVPGLPVAAYMYGRSVYGPGGYAGAGNVTVSNGIFPSLRPGETSSFLFTGGGSGKVHVRPTYW